jgi:S1 RNA binding domain
VPSPLQCALSVPAFGREIRLASPPWLIQRLGPAPLARLRGLRPAYAWSETEGLAIPSTRDPGPRSPPVLDLSGRQARRIAAWPLASTASSAASLSTTMSEDRKKRRDDLFRQLQVGDLLTGTVSGLMSYGAFVDIGGADGLVHVSELSWDPVRRVTDVLHLGDRVNVKVVKLAPERNHIMLSLRQANLPDDVDARPS